MQVVLLAASMTISLRLSEVSVLPDQVGQLRAITSRQLLRVHERGDVAVVSLNHG